MSENALALLGGSFNPIHIGHLRLAIEIAEHFAQHVAEVVLMPSAHPPHKENLSVLPFSMRCDMVSLAIKDIPFLRLSTFEGERETPSYTWETLSRLSQRFPKRSFYFIMGGDDYEQLGTWYRGLELPKLTNFFVVPRKDASSEWFFTQTKKLWSHARCTEESAYLDFGSRAIFYTPPCLQISATQIRKRFIAGKSLSFLVPDSVYAYLMNHKEIVLSTWTPKAQYT